VQCAALAAQAQAPSGKVSVVTSFAKDVTDPIKKAFEAATPGTTLDVQNGVRTGDIDLWVDAPFTSGAQLLAIGRPISVSIDLDLARWIAA
jgi:ABC-type glycerol-3-phosphate transport system substrate-binding protein